MNIKIKQVAIDEKRIYALAEDDKMYVWNHGSASWDPYWNQRTSEEKLEERKEVTGEFSTPPPPSVS